MLSLSLLAEQCPAKTDKESGHGYISGFYEGAFAPLRDKPIRLLEIGIAEGGSLELWRRAFPNAEAIVGIDVGEIPVLSEGITTIQADAYNLDFMMSLGTFDIIIDDGSHNPEHQVFVGDNYGKLLKPGGYLIIEDIPDVLLLPLLESCAEDMHVVDMREGRPADSLLVWWKAAD